jgi:hypothetical protein
MRPRNDAVITFPILYFRGGCNINQRGEGYLIQYNYVELTNAEFFYEEDKGGDKNYPRPDKV